MRQVPYIPQESVGRLSSRVSARGLLVRGVVIAVYTPDQAGSGSGRPIAAPNDLAGIYCDVLLYSDYPGLRGQLLRNCLVTTGRGGVYDDAPWIPAPATFDLSTKKPVTRQQILSGASPLDLDGDHVLVGFMDDSVENPVILRGIPHPRNRPEAPSNLPNQGSRSFRRLSAEASWGQPSFQIHRGVYVAIDNGGNFHIDARDAYDGRLGPDARPLREDTVDPATGIGAAGNIFIETSPLGAVSLANSFNTVVLSQWGFDASTNVSGFQAGLTLGGVGADDTDRRMLLYAQTDTWNSRIRFGVGGKIEISAGLTPGIPTDPPTADIWLRGNRVQLSNDAWELEEAAIRGSTFLPELKSILSALNTRVTRLEATESAAAAATNDVATVTAIAQLQASYAVTAAAFDAGPFLSTRVYLDPPSSTPVPEGQTEVQ